MTDNTATMKTATNPHLTTTPQARNTAPASIDSRPLKLLARAPSTVPFLPETQPALVCSPLQRFMPLCRAAYAIRILGQSHAGINVPAHDQSLRRTSFRRVRLLTS